MMSSPGILMTVLAFIAVIGPLVFVHEMGHYLVARWCGVKAEIFSIGFGPEIAAWVDRRGTRWRIAAFPLGGYVKFAGDMGIASQSDPEWLALPAAEREQGFPAKSVWQRMAIVAAGPCINLAFAVLLLAGLAMTYGTPVSEPVIGKVASASAAEKAGLRPGDRVISIMGREIEDFRDISAIISLRPNEVLPYVIERNGDRFEQNIAAGERIEKDRFGNIYRIGLLGVGTSAVKLKPVSVLEAPLIGATQAIDVTRTGIDGMGQIITGRRPVTEMGGPLKIADISGQAAMMGVPSFLFFMALISINLGFINLLPIPMLDGGHLFFYMIEAVRRRPVSQQVMEWAYRSGMALLLSLMLLVTINDLGSFGLWRSLSRLIG
ncbi:MAG: RIP metalloprotease RseP [Sphingobium sp.]|nr:RIP metalloprotease RseP [Sphingobium sp.]MBP6111195.1 RIP metalloprotease RseP [Sphingobium sp.]MBP8671685.1 RIP metalloprotease RseP [Sphingobium sp.]MBP9157183.1 RIP metalloprotease RseP [Sphingobium sp.]MCC6483048.1 RIP metalloprotease RseP [Sphingomonadaceae bacterium]